MSDTLSLKQIKQIKHDIRNGFKQKRIAKTTGNYHVVM
jgi:hypothetical protein